MDKLLKDYLENDFDGMYKNVTIKSSNYNAHMCKVVFEYNEGQTMSSQIDIWSILSFVYNSKSN